MAVHIKGKASVHFPYLSEIKLKYCYCYYTCNLSRNIKDNYFKQKWWWFIDPCWSSTYTLTYFFKNQNNYKIFPGQSRSLPVLLPPVRNQKEESAGDGQSGDICSLTLHSSQIQIPKWSPGRVEIKEFISNPAPSSGQFTFNITFLLRVSGNMLALLAEHSNCAVA